MPRSTRPFLFPDINVWIALTYDRHVHHVSARNWFASVGHSGRFFFCRFTQLGLLRLLTAEPVMGRDEVMTQEEAWAAYDKWMEDDRVTFLEEPPEVEGPFRGLTRATYAAPKDWGDSYLAAFASAAQLTIVTFDQAFRTKTKELLLLKG